MKLESQKFRSMTTQLSVMFTGLICVLGLLLLIPAIQMIHQHSIQGLCTELSKVVGTASLDIDGHAHKKFNNNTSTNDPKWLKMRVYLENVRQVNNLEREHIYTFKLHPTDPELLLFGVMLHDPPFVGSTYQIPEAFREKVRLAFDTSQPQYTDIYKDDFGHWISAFTPIYDQQKQAIGLLQADQRVDTGTLAYLRLATDQLLPMVGLFALVVILGFGCSLFITRRLTFPLQQMADLARFTSVGNWEHPMPDMKWRELRPLGRAFERMRRKVQSQTEDLIAFNHELEAKVDEKTRNLRKANDSLKQAQSDLEAQAQANLEFTKTHDPLTGLGNRAWFADQLTLAVAKAQLEDRMVAVIIVGLDRFNKVNELAGTSEGDRVLKAISNRLVQSLKVHDVVARVDGDGFAVILPDIKREETMIKVAQRLLDKVSLPFKVRHMNFHLTASIGISVYPNDCREVGSLLRDASTAMFNAKKDGGNAFRFYTSTMDLESRRQLALESGLRQALDNEEFVLYYQPQLDVLSGDIVGAEALIRWISPKEGLIPPSEFIPLAEETGLIVPLGKWVIRTACQHRKKWNTMGLPSFLVAVNLSGRQFEQSDLVSFMRKTLDEEGLEPLSLELEITESVAMKDVKTTVSKLAELKAMGMTLAIDDFGTGYSSLSYLKQFAIEKLKIDRSFVTDVSHNSEDAAIVNAIVQLGHSLGLKVIAEGVEYREQLEFLRDCGCDEYQGYYFSKPIPEEDFVALIQKALA